MIKSILEFIEVDGEIENEILLIVNDEMKKKFLKIQRENNIIEPIKIMTLLELKKVIFKEKSSEVDLSKYLINEEKLSIHELNDVLKILPFIDINIKYKSKRLNILKNIKTNMLNRNLIYDELVTNFLDKFDIVLLDVHLDPFYYKYLNKIKSATLKSDKIRNKQTSFENITTEVDYVLNKIAKDIDLGVDINDIYIYIPSMDYEILLQTYCNLYSIKCEFSKSKSLYSFNVVKKILSDLEKNQFDYTMKKYINFDNTTIINKVIQILNQFDTNDTYDNIKDILIYKLKKTKIGNDVRLESINVRSFTNRILTLNDERHYCLGFNQNLITKINKDNDYLSDEEKKELFLSDSSEKNQFTNLIIKKNIETINNLLITFSENHLERSYEPASILMDIDLEINDEKLKYVSYSKENDKITFYKEFEKLRKYNYISNTFKQLSGLKEYINFDNQYNSIVNNNLLVKRLSHTKIEQFFLCQYKFYLKYILNVNSIRKNSSYITIGNFFHFVLENAITLKVDATNLEVFIDKKTKEFINSLKECKSSQKFYIKKQAKSLVKLIEYIIFEIERRGYNDEVFPELEMEKVINDNVILEGKADLILSKINNEDAFFEIYDYKTGDITIDIDEIEYGLNMQNIIYYILLKEKMKYEGKSYLDGFYKQKVKPKILKDDEDYISQFNINGYGKDRDTYILNRKSIKDISDINILDIEMKVLNNIDVMQKKIKKNDFQINPKYLYSRASIKNKSCVYCDYLDICNRRKENFIYLNKK